MLQQRNADYMKFKESRFFEYFNMLIDQIEHLHAIGVNFVFFQTPLAQNVNDLSQFEKLRLAEWEFDFNHISEKDCQIIKQIYSSEVKTSYLQQVYDGCFVYEADSIKYLADFQSRYVNIIDGKRVTYYQPKEFSNGIYIFGQCTARGTGVEDKHTIQSFLQNILNDKYIDSYQVVNCGIGNGSDLHDDIVHMKQTNFKRGDIVILCTNLEIVPVYLFEENHIDYFDCSHLFHRPHNCGEWFTDSTFHTNANGNRVIARYIMDLLEEKGLLEEGPNLGCKETDEINEDGNLMEETIIPYTEELNQYLTSLIPYKKSEEYNGCIVMNCNPFTEGHKYLIEKAAKEVDNLYIFVVEENRSFFSFEDRMELVKLGTAHLNNVIVLSSGKFIISAVTFPGYFYKDGNKEIQVNPSLDIRIFGKYIAKVLELKARYAGEEPNDFVTRTYNEKMKEILPLYGIKFVEIKRKEQNGQVVSASLVRRMLKEKDFEGIERLVPETTYAYLKKKYG